MTETLINKKPFFIFRKKEKNEKLGTLKGVFIPNILQMIGVILFMRLSWILGHVGMTKMGMIIGISSLLLFVTSLSMTSIVSNMKMEGGGSYYLISRTLGIDFGSAIGLLLCCSQLASISLSISGFSLSLYEFFPGLSLPIIKASTLFALMVISFISTDLALKTQIIIFVTLSISVASIFFGGSQNLPSTLQPALTQTSLGFWAGFAMFFPATTGIESGMSMSGDLKKPSLSLPIGTIGAVLAAFVLYFSMAYFISSNVSSDLLKSYPMIVYYLSKYGLLVIIGIWGATLSSAMGSFLGAPRIVQAIANDGILPKFLGKGTGASNQPTVAMVIIFCLAVVLTLFMDINQIIPILTMACLISYGLMNFVCFFQEFLRNPSWRPTFRVHWLLSLAGALACLSAMFMINPGATFAALTLTILICLWTTSRKVKGNWDDLRYSLYSYLIQKGASKLIKLEKNPKSWRPHILTVFNSPFISKKLAFFSHTLNQEKGLLTFATVLSRKKDQLLTLDEVKESADTHLSSYRIPSYVHVCSSKNEDQGISQMINNYGLGPLKPNTVILSLKDLPQDSDLLAHIIIEAHADKKNILLLKEDSKESESFFSTQRDSKQINLWWGGEYTGNFEFSLALSHILQISTVWWNAKICINTLVPNLEIKQKKELQFDRYQKRLRIKNLMFNSIVNEESNFHSVVLNNSRIADLTFIGLRSPEEDETVESYKDYLSNFLEQTNNLNDVVFVLAGENLSFEKIFFE